MNNQDSNRLHLESQSGCSPFGPEWKYPASLPSHLWNQGFDALEFFQRCEKLWYQEILRMITCWAHQLHSCRRDCGPRPEGLSVPFHEPEERKIFCFPVVLTNLKWKILFSLWWMKFLTMFLFVFPPYQPTPGDLQASHILMRGQRN